MQHGVVSDQDRKVAGLVGCLEAEAVAIIRHRRTHVADRKRRNGPEEASDGPTIKMRHALKCRRSTGAPLTLSVLRALPPTLGPKCRFARFATPLTTSARHGCRICPGAEVSRAWRSGRRSFSCRTTRA